jgi:hypothetical protein
VDDLNSETLSLHLNPGQARNSKKNGQRNIAESLSSGIIYLEDLYHSTSTFDSDAAPLDSDAIAALSSTAAQASTFLMTGFRGLTDFGAK